MKLGDSELLRGDVILIGPTAHVVLGPSSEYSRLRLQEQIQALGQDAVLVLPLQEQVPVVVLNTTDFTLPGISLEEAEVAAMEEHLRDEMKGAA